MSLNLNPVLVVANWEMLFVIMCDILRVLSRARKMVTFCYEGKRDPLKILVRSTITVCIRAVFGTTAGLNQVR